MINKLLYGILKPLADIVDFIERIWIELFSGTIFQQITEQPWVKGLFWGFWGLGVTLLLFIAFFKGIQGHVSYDCDRPKQVAANAAKGLGTMVILVLLTTMVFGLTMSISETTKSDDYSSSGQQIVELGMNEQVIALDIDRWNALFKKTDANGDVIGTRIPSYSEMKKTVDDMIREEENIVMGDPIFGTDDEAWQFKDDYNPLPPLLALIPVAISLIMCLFVTVKRLFDIILLYIISPLPCATYPLNDGEGFNNWFKDFFSVSITGVIMWFCYILSGQIETGIAEAITKTLQLGDLGIWLQLILKCCRLFLICTLTSKFAKVLGLNVDMSASIKGAASGVMAMGASATQKVRDISNGAESELGRSTSTTEEGHVDEPNSYDDGYNNYDSGASSGGASSGGGTSSGGGSPSESRELQEPNFDSYNPSTDGEASQSGTSSGGGKQNNDDLQQIFGRFDELSTAINGNNASQATADSTNGIDISNYINPKKDKPSSEPPTININIDNGNGTAQASYTQDGATTSVSANISAVEPPKGE